MPTSASDSISILLIEDNPGDARLIQEMLGEARPATFNLERVDRLASGIDHLQRNHQVDVVLTDLGLPDSQGWDTFARVRATVPHVPIIVLTGLDDEATALKAISEGAQDYLVKGQVQGYLLPRAIRYAIERKRSEAEKAHEDPYKAKNPAEFVRQSAGELKKVVWPTWPETVKMYSAVLVFVLIMIAIVSLMDYAFGWGLLKIFGS